MTYSGIFSRFSILTSKEHCRLEVLYDGTRQRLLSNGDLDFINVTSVYGVEFRVPSRRQ